MARIKPHFGYDVHEDVRDYTIEDRDYLVYLLQRHKVLRWRNQDLTTEQLVNFSEIYGTVWENDSNGILYGNGESHAYHPDTHKITLVSNDKSRGVLGDMEVSWHCDVSHKPYYTKGGTMPFRSLYCVKTSDDETSVTSWFDQCWLYDNCPDDLLDEIKDLKIINQAKYDTAWTANIMPFILTDPIDNKKSIALQKIFFEGFLGKNSEETKIITDKLFAIATDPNNVIRHEWVVGDLIVSNSYNTAHQRERMYTKQERTLWRTTFQIPELVPQLIKPDTF